MKKHEKSYPTEKDVFEIIQWTWRNFNKDFSVDGLSVTAVPIPQPHTYQYKVTIGEVNFLASRYTEYEETDRGRQDFDIFWQSGKMKLPEVMAAFEPLLPKTEQP